MQEKNKQKIEIYDTTLRDGGQSFDIDFTLKDKIRLVKELDKFGMDYIEFGWPRHDSIDMELAKSIKQSELKNSKLVIFGSTRRISGNAKDDPVLNTLIKAGMYSGTEIVTIFGKTWVEHVEKQLKATKEQNLEAITDSIMYLKNNKTRPFSTVIYDAEHFFDGYKDDEQYAKDTIKHAILAGADNIVLCETNGGCMHFEVGEITKDVRRFIDIDQDIQEYLRDNNKEIVLGIHCHDDSGLAVAGTIEAIRNGAMHIHGTINGIGERIGNANLCTIIGDFAFKKSLNENYALNETITQNLKGLTHLSKDVTAVAGIEENLALPYVGLKAFAHDGGVHVDAILKGATYNHIDPELVGNRMRINLSSNSGKAAAVYTLKNLGFIKDGEESNPSILDFLKKVHEYSSMGFNMGLLEDEHFYLAQEVFGKRTIDLKIERCDLSTQYLNNGYNRHSDVCVLDLSVNGDIKPGVGRGKAGQLGVAFEVMKDLVAKAGYNSNLILSNYKVSPPKGNIGAKSLIQVLITYRTPKNNLIITSAIDSNIVIASIEACRKALTLYSGGYKC